MSEGSKGHQGPLRSHSFFPNFETVCNPEIRIYRLVHLEWELGSHFRRLLSKFQNSFCTQEIPSEKIYTVKTPGRRSGKKCGGKKSSNISSAGTRKLRPGPSVHNVIRKKRGKLFQLEVLFRFFLFFLWPAWCCKPAVSRGRFRQKAPSKNLSERHGRKFRDSPFPFRQTVQK